MVALFLNLPVIAIPHQLSVLQRTNFAVQWGANRANSECVDYLR